MRNPLFALLLLGGMIIPYMNIGAVNDLSSKEFENFFQLIPKPQKLDLKSGKGLYFAELNFLVAAENITIPALGNLTNSLPQSKQRGNKIHLQLSASASLPSYEGYILDVTDNGNSFSTEIKKVYFMDVRHLNS